MENKINTTLMQTLQDKRPIFVRYARKLTRNDERADDLVQHVALRLLQYPIEFEVENDVKFLFTMIYQASANKWRTEKKYLFLGDAHSTQTEEAVRLEQLLQANNSCTYEGDLVDSFKILEIARAADRLPKKQKAAIMNALHGNDIGEIELGGLEGNLSHHPQYNSLKTNKRLAIQKLKEELS